MKKGFAIFIILCFLFSCAPQQNQPLSGGPKDTIPPEIVRSSPAVFDTNFKDDEIEIKFNEFILFNNIDLNFFSSPPFNENPDFKNKRKKLIIKLNEPLLDSVTYTFKFKNSIIDLHESNPIKNFQFVFSTYDSLDYLSVSGKVLDAYTFEPLSNVAVMLYRKFADSIPFNSIPIYADITDSLGVFNIQRIRKGKYKIFALEDMNNNLIYNKDESRIAFSDTLIKPWSKTLTITDTLDSGTVIVNPEIDTIKDTLRYDSVTVRKDTLCFPDKLNLLMFTEGSAAQEIKRSVRISKGEVKLYFVKPLLNYYFNIYPLNDSAAPFFDYRIENYKTYDSLGIWFFNKNFYNNDSISFIAEFLDNDTLLTEDTLTFNVYDYGTDTIPLQIDNLRDNISIYEDFTLLSKNPVSNIDTSKIHLFKKIDTLVIDDKKQKINVIRPAFDSLVFVFKRPIVKDFFIEFDDYSGTDIPAIWTTNTANDSVYCKIINTSLKKKDTLKFTAFYDNMFFFNQRQKLSSHHKLTKTYQRIIKTNRFSQDSIIFKFKKDIPLKIDIDLLDYSDSAFYYNIRNNIINVFLNNENAINKDSLYFVFKFVDMKQDDGEIKYYQDTLPAIYVFDRQKIEYKRRYLRSKVLLGFKKPLLSTPDFDVMYASPSSKWYALHLNETMDTARLNIRNHRIIRMNKLRLVVKYFDINQHSDTLWFNDTLSLEVDRSTDNNTRIIGQEIELNLLKPINYTVHLDSIINKRCEISTEYMPGNKYKIKIDSAAFTDFYGKVNDSINFDFEVFSPEDFASLFLKIENVWTVLDSLSVDTSEYYVLPQGQLILDIEDENGEVYKSLNFNYDKAVKEAMFLPGKYNLRLFYDQNNDGFWNTGNYLKKIQPEKVYIYNKTITLEKGDQKKIIWDLANQEEDDF